MRYLKDILNYSILFDEFQKFCLIEYLDSDWEMNLQDKKSTIKSLIKIADESVFWHSTKQTEVSLFSTETEYIVTSETAKNIIIIHDILVKLDVISVNFTFSLLINNTESIAVSESKKITQNIRHVDICYHHIRDLIQNDMIEVLHIFSRDMTANRLIKTLNIIKFKEFIGLIEILKIETDSNSETSDDETSNSETSVALRQ